VVKRHPLKTDQNRIISGDTHTEVPSPMIYDFDPHSSLARVKSSRDITVFHSLMKMQMIFLMSALFANIQFLFEAMNKDYLPDGRENYIFCVTEKTIVSTLFPDVQAGNCQFWLIDRDEDSK